MKLRNNPCMVMLGWIMSHDYGLKSVCRVLSTTNPSDQITFRLTDSFSSKIDPIIYFNWWFVTWRCCKPCLILFPGEYKQTSFSIFYIFFYLNGVLVSFLNWLKKSWKIHLRHNIHRKKTVKSFSLFVGRLSVRDPTKCWITHYGS